ncbi:MAG: methylenetetrahydrofolate reductase [Nitrospirota bacterium]|nr:methylenetetrahydrofolate reductase [Nitrospirota bacterium]
MSTSPPRSRLEAVLRAGHFAVTAELTPPKSAVTQPLIDKARMVLPYVDAANLTDCQTAVVRMSSFACSLVVRGEGVEPVLQMTCRDRNLIGIQADLLGAWALGLRNLLALSGDSPRIGDHPEARPVFDVNSFKLLKMVRLMRETGTLANGKPIKEAPQFYLGAAFNPVSVSMDAMVRRLEKKADKGAEFVQTQMVFDVEQFDALMRLVVAEGLHQRVKVLAGVAPLKSVRMAEYMNAHVPGIVVPPHLIERLRVAEAAGGPEQALAEGVNICLEVIEGVRHIPGVAGIHIMAVFCEETVPDIVTRAGLYPRPHVEDFLLP